MTAPPPARVSAPSIATALALLLVVTGCAATDPPVALAEPYDTPPTLVECVDYTPVERGTPDRRIGRVDVLVDFDGGVLATRPVGSGEWAALAAELAAGCTFDPAVKDGAPVAGWMRHEFSFREEPR